MLAVEGVVGPSTTTFPTPATIAMATTATAPTVVAGAGVGLLPLVSVATAVEPADPRSLLMPVSALSGSSPAGNNTGSTTATSTANTNTSNNNNNNSSAVDTEEFVKPIVQQDGEVLLEVECGQNKASMYLSKLCQGSKGPCIHFQGSWLTPNEFQFVSGRETAKDWKRSIRHHGKSLKLLLAKGILSVHPTMCDCDGCRIGAVLTRKGEKRRIPNGERKRKSTSNTPENSGNGAFRAVGNLTAIKNQDGPPEPKRPALDKSVEGNQSPLKESSLLNLPAEVKEVSGGRPADPHLQDVGKLPVNSRLASPPAFIPLAPSDLKPGDSSHSGLASGLTVPQEHKDSSAAVTPRPQQQPALAAPVSLSPDVKVLSSSTAASITALDKSLSRLALYHAASASLKGAGTVGASLPEAPSHVSTPKRDKPLSQRPSSDHENDSNGSSVSSSSIDDNLGQSATDDQHCDARSPPPQHEVKNLPVDSEAPAKPVVVVVPEGEQKESKDLKSEDSPHNVVSHSVVPHVKLCEPNNNNNNNSSSISVSVSAPLSLPAPVAAMTSPVIAAAAPAASNNMPHMTEAEPQKVSKDTSPKHADTSSAVPSSSSSSALLSPHSRHSEKEGHITIRHPSPERPPKEKMEPPVKPSPVKSSKEHSAEKHKDRKSENTSSSAEHRDRHGSKDMKEVPTSRHDRDRDSDRRRQEERADRDRKAGSSMSGQSSKVDDASSSSRGPPEPVVSVGGGRVEGIPTSMPMMPAVAVPTPVADPAAFSEYMRVLAASHNGFVPPSMGIPPGMFPLRPPAADPSLSSAAMMHPMAAAACGMFSSPAALLPKDPVMYPASAATMPPVSYGYGAAPGMPPLSLIPQQYSTAASAAMLDYSRHVPYLHWPGGLPVMMPDAMNAAAVAVAAAGSKRSREEMEAAMEKRLQMSVPPYGMAPVNPMDYMAAYRGLAAPLPNGLEAAMYDKNAELLRKRMYGELSASVGNVVSKSLVDSPYLASLPEYYRALFCCPCMENQPGDIRTWHVEDVVKLVSSLEGCGVYSEIFRDQRVDGKILVLLTTDLLMKNLGMKMGPAVTLTSRVAKLLLDATRSSGCSSCQQLASMAPAVKSAVYS